MLPPFRYKNITIKKKLMFSILLTSGFALAVGCILFIIIDRHNFRSSMIKDLEILAEIIGNNSSAALIFDNSNDAQNVLKALKAKENIITACIYAKNDTLFATYQRLIAGSDSLPAYKPEAASQFDRSSLVVLRPIISENDTIGTVYIKSDLKPLIARLENIIYIIFFIFIGAIAGSFFISLVLQRTITDPISRLVKVARKVSQVKDYSIRAAKHSEDEVGLLTESFNLMLAQIQERDKELQDTHQELKSRATELQKELAERLLAETQLKTSLKEKEVLLKEIHHRVKNNLQIISSLIYLQSRGITDEKALQLFRESQNRVKSMALIHEKLYQSKDLAQIDFSEYIKTLVDHLFNSYNINTHAVHLNLRIENLALSIDTAIYCGIIINELVSNSLKHAFHVKDKIAGEISIQLYTGRPGEFELVVGDNGIGFPEDFNLQQAQSLGLQLVNNLTDQLGGKIEMKRNGGTVFMIRFPLLK